MAFDIVGSCRWWMIIDLINQVKKFVIQIEFALTRPDECLLVLNVYTLKL
jgi:hypothetical protein